MKPLHLATVALLALCLQGCCLFGRTTTIYTPLPEIPLEEPPELTRDPAQDVPILGADAMRSRNLITRYNELAQRVNERHGVETPTLESLDLSDPEPAPLAPVAEEPTTP